MAQSTDLSTENLVQKVGTFKHDRLVGGAIAEEIVGDTTEDISGNCRGGNDHISAQDGADHVYGDTNARLIEQSKGGNDRIKGGGGNDTVFGDAQFITNSARGGSDWIFGEEGGHPERGCQQPVQQC